MFRDRDLIARALGTLLPARLGHRLGDALTPPLGAARGRHAGAAAGGAAAGLLADPAAGAEVAGRFVAALAADDLDACRAWANVGQPCGAALVEGERHLPAPGAAVFVSFHLSGGLAVFEVLRRRGFAPTFLRAPTPQGATRYARVIAAARLRYLARVLERPWILTGSGARAALDEHLSGGGSVVALIDVPVQAVELRDRAAGVLFGRALSVPCGLLRLALARQLPVVPFDGRIEHGRRIVRFHQQVSGADVESLLAGVLCRLEGVVRERPWDWHAWLELDHLLSRAAPTTDV
jgi:hypothetical protein